MFHFKLAGRAADLRTTLPIHRDDIISFGAGDAFPGLLPDLTEEAHAALSTFRSEALQYGGRAGLADLREWVAHRLSSPGAPLSSENILIVNGAKHALDLICSLLTEPGDSIVVGAPTYHTGIPIFRHRGLSFVEVGHDLEGLKIEELRTELSSRRRRNAPLPRFIYEIPDFQNPSGVTMSADRRRSLIELALEYGIPVVEDSPYREVRFAGEAVPPLKTFDSQGCVFHVGTFAKLLAPGLRVGWIATTSENVARLGLLKADGGSSPLTQRIIYQVCASGKLDAHIARVTETYRSHMETMVEALTQHAPTLSFRRPEGGYYLWARLPSGVDADAVATAALAQGVEIIPGTRFHAGTGAQHPSNRRPGSDHIRLGYSFPAPHEIREGVVRLADALSGLATDGGRRHDK